MSYVAVLQRLFVIKITPLQTWKTLNEIDVRTYHKLRDFLSLLIEKLVESRCSWRSSRWVERGSPCCCTKPTVGKRITGNIMVKSKSGTRNANTVIVEQLVSITTTPSHWKLQKTTSNIGDIQISGTRTPKRLAPVVAYELIALYAFFICHDMKGSLRRPIAQMTGLSRPVYTIITSQKANFSFGDPLC